MEIRDTPSLCHGTKRNFRTMTMKELESCIEAYGKDIYNFCLHLTKETEQAEELYQDTFLTAVEIRGRINNTENPKSYLLSICVRLWKNKQRKWAWRNRISPISTLVEACNKDVFHEDTDTILEAEKIMVVRKSIQKLDDKYRLVVLLYYMEELSLKQISQILHLPTGTIKTRLYTARKLLKSELEGYFYES